MSSYTAVPQPLSPDSREFQFRKRLYKMLMRSGFGDIVRSDGTVIKRTLGRDFDELVRFALDNRLDNERSATIYRLYAVHKHREIVRVYGAI